MSYLERELQKIGFSDKEARVYLAGVETGPSSAQELARRSGVNRATTYVMIESLSGRGLMSSFMKGKKRFFVTEPPSNILSIVKEEKIEIQEKEKRVEALMSDLNDLIGKKDQPQVMFFEGEKGIERLRRSVLESGVKEVEEFSPIDEAYKFFPPSEKDHRDTFRKKFDIRLIYTSKKGAFLPEKEEGVERRFIPSDQFSFGGDIAIYGSKVNIIYYAPQLVGVLIEHDGISETFRNMFSLAWLGALEQKKKGTA
ncbi:MAG: helix-turn-helix domain-containing protein [Patescibacteria group bacterium]|nr:helix-turn-helix domain-containing protein [Patescibacteria group bacterium]